MNENDTRAAVPVDYVWMDGTPVERFEACWRLSLAAYESAGKPYVATPRATWPGGITTFSGATKVMPR